MSLLDFENVCRLCLRQDNLMSSIFEENNEKNSELLARRITCIARVEVHPEDGLPTSICEECKSQVEQFYKFRLLVEVSDKTLRQHLKSAHNSMVYTLTIPSLNDDLGMWEDNLIENHCKESVEELKCNVPIDEENSFNNNNNNSENISNEPVSEKYCCELCLVQFCTLDDLKNHVVEHCSVTKQVTKKESVSNVDRTLIANQENNPRRSNQANKSSEVCLVKCETCSESFTKASIKKHSMRCAWRQTELVCEECGMTFNKKSELRYHKGAHLPSPLMCELCNKQFRNVQSYNIHMKRHTVGSRFSCETCGKRYYTNSELARHVQKHSDKRKHPCHLCETAFLSRPELNRHLKYHNGVKKFKCNLCSKSYYESGHLKVHMRVHTGEKPFVCKCGKAFITKSKLIRHEKIHNKKMRSC
ncbi:zinc finger protein 3 homolog [Chelonus insularis]|uniref:zinc finger protein 3 homolog n=1 Tax=Chelonus insularis TaxID=460826 RepID=UPI00158A7684|nr:zinc finger protein 3 homolog [Chelonus insularis]